MDIDIKKQLGECDHMCFSGKMACCHRGQRFLVNALRVAALAMCGVCFTGQVVAQVVAPVPVPWGIEGPLTAIDPAAGTISVSNMKVKIPPELTLTGTSGINGASLQRLLDSQAPSRARSVYASQPGSEATYVGGTLKAAGIIVDGPSGREYVATEAVLELSENVVVGILDSIDVADESCVINGIQCRLNKDERFTVEVLDAAGTHVSFSDCVNAAGAQVGAVGYMVNGVLYVQSLEVQFVRHGTVSITRAQSVRANRNRVRVEGLIAPFVEGETVSIYDAVTGTRLGVARVIADVTTGGGAFTLDVRNLARVATQVKAISSSGAETTSAVEAR
jgi:hypothetical protein